MIKFSTYVDVVKPGIVRANVFTALAGYALGANGEYRLKTVLGLVCGVALVIAGGCVINNIEDRFRDKRMERTRKRALVNGDMSPLQATVYSIILITTGIAVLSTMTNGLTVLVGMVGLIDYTVLYAVAKRHSRYGTITGSVSGAVAIVAGYTTATGRVDTSFWLLFAAMVSWQMAHFYAIGAYRKSDYAAAGLYVAAHSWTLRQLRFRTLCFIFMFAAIALALQVENELPVWYGWVSAALVGWWLAGTAQLGHESAEKWGRSVFFRSLPVLLGWCVTLGLASHPI